jgi:SpoVK/Ycf46/Vps4 family AAA+-type ATPase
MSWYKFSDDQNIYYANRSPRMRKFHHFSKGEEIKNKLEEIVESGNEVELKQNGILIEYYNDVSSLTPAEVPNGVYLHTPATHSQPEKITVMTPREDRVLDLLPELRKVKDEIDWFQANKEVYDKAQTRYARSFMIYGPPGTGKSSWIRGLTRDIDAIIIYINDIPSQSFCKYLSQIDKLKIIVFEEFITLFEDYNLSTILQFLDGEFSISNCISFLTTNHPEKIPENVIRCGRVDQFYRIGFPDKDARKKFFLEMFQYDATEDDLKATEGLAVADLREIYLVFLQQSLTIAESVKAIKKRHELIKKDFGSAREIGLSRY